MRKLVIAVLFLISAITGALAGEIKGDWKFPSDIAISNGKLYVVDGLNNRIAVYDLYGQHLTDIKLDSPFGITAKDGLLYVTSQKGMLYVMDETGNIEKSFRLRGRPIDVVRIKDRLLITNGKDETIDIYSLDGKLLKSVGGKGSEPGKFVGIFMIDSSPKLAFVVDSVNARIQEFDREGNYVNSFGVFGIEEGDLFRPKGIAYCGEGTVAVSDAITGAVQLFDTYGGFEKVVARGLYYPTAVACYKGEVFVLEPLKNRVLTFKIQGVK